MVYLCGGGAGRLSSWPFTPFVLGVCAAAGLEGAGEEENSRSISMGWGVGWSAMADMAEWEKRFRCSGGKFSGWESSSYLDERRDE